MNDPSQTDLDEFAARYVAAWNEPDAEARRKAVAELWVEDGQHFTPSVAVRGYDELADRIAGAYTQWVGPGEYVFRSVPGANGHHDAVRFNWEMVHIASGQVISVGFDFVTLAPDGRIRLDYQFVDSSNPR